MAADYTTPSRALSSQFALMIQAAFLSHPFHIRTLTMLSRHFARFLAGGLFAGIAFAAVGQSVSGTPSTASQGDVGFMTHAANDGVSEVAMGKLALETSANPALKKLAQRIVDDHSKANEELHALAQGKQITLPSPPATDENATALKDKKAASFDQAWTDMMVKNHQKAIALFTKEKRQAQDPDIRNFAEKTLPVLNAHLDAARKLQDQLTYAGARDGAMGTHTPMGASAFDHVADPAAASTASSELAPAAAASVGVH